MQLITSINQYQNLLELFVQKATKTNNFLLLEQVNALLTEHKLFFTEQENNLVFLVNRRISYQIYFHLNNLNNSFNIVADKPLMMEMVYRGEANRPHDILNFWENNGFKTHLTRDNLALIYNKKNTEININKHINVQLASTDNEANYTTTLFEKDLDKYTGDLKTYEEILLYVKNKNVLCAYEGEKICGALQFEWKNNNCWLGHIVVDEAYRGKGIAPCLVNRYLELNKQNEQSRYQLWVIQDNKPAVDLYKKFGFIYAGKSTVSMLKM